MVPEHPAVDDWIQPLSQQYAQISHIWDCAAYFNTKIRHIPGWQFKMLMRHGINHFIENHMQQNVWKSLHYANNPESFH